MIPTMPPNHLNSFNFKHGVQSARQSLLYQSLGQTSTNPVNRIIARECSIYLADSGKSTSERGTSACGFVVRIDVTRASNLRASHGRTNGRRGGGGLALARGRERTNGRTTVQMLRQSCRRCAAAGLNHASNSVGQV